MTIERQLAEIADQCRKRHWWNAIYRLHELLGELLRIQNDVLKGRSLL